MESQLPAGFRMSGVACGIKVSGKTDLTLIVADQEATAAGVYTQNLVCAAPVILDRTRTPSGRIRGVVVNSGNANACTGERGMRDAQEMARLVAQRIDAHEDQVLVMSTGVIGVFLPMEKVRTGIEQAAQHLAADPTAFERATQGIMTTDKFQKSEIRSVSLESGPVRLAGMAKGAGMIGPNMATLLGVILTDARLAPEDAQHVLQTAVAQSFNCISVEGHTSTNDTVLLLASGQAHATPLGGAELEKFSETLTQQCIKLAKMIPADGEGASHLIEIHVRGTRDRSQAVTIAETIANSALVKTAVTGNDPNWGRIVSAAGYAGVDFDPAEVDLAVNGMELYRAGTPLPFDEQLASAAIRDAFETRLELKVGTGAGEATHWTSDLTLDYVRFNSEYTT